MTMPSAAEVSGSTTTVLATDVTVDPWARRGADGDEPMEEC